MASGDYRSKGVHTNRKGGKTKVKAMDRKGGPYKSVEGLRIDPDPKPRTVADNIESVKKAGGGNRIPGRDVPAGKATDKMVEDTVKANQTQSKQKRDNAELYSTISKAAADSAAAGKKKKEREEAEHMAAVAEGSAMQQRMMQSSGRAADIIKKKRI